MQSRFTNTLTLVLVILLCSVSAWFILKPTPPPPSQSDEQRQIDSLYRVINSLGDSIFFRDSLVTTYKRTIARLDEQIEGTKHQIDSVRIHYQKQIANISGMSDSELELFFKQRYGY